jgi:hypothetical protein
LEPFPTLAAALLRANVRFVVIGVSGINHYAQTAGLVFTTQDRDLFLPADPKNELKVSRRALVRADGHGLLVDFSLVMAGFTFDDVWSRRRVFKVEGLEVPVASLKDIVSSKAAAGRPKDRLFLATHEEALRELGRRRRGTASTDSPKKNRQR